MKTPKSKLPKGYIQASNCTECKFVFVKFDWDDPPEYYCMFAPGERPKCGSVLMKEHFLVKEPEWTRGNKAWNKWAQGRQVFANGICPEFRKKDL